MLSAHQSHVTLYLVSLTIKTYEMNSDVGKQSKDIRNQERRSRE